MGWNVTEYEGKKCYERGGVRVFRTQDIEALDRQEQLEIDQRDESFQHRFDEIEDAFEPEENSTSTTIIILIMLIVVIAAVVIENYK